MAFTMIGQSNKLLYASVLAQAINPTSVEWAITAADNEKITGAVFNSAFALATPAMDSLQNTAAVIASSTAMAAVAASSTAMAAVIASSTAMAAVIASSTAMAAVAASSTAMAAVIASSTAMAAVIANSAAMDAVNANDQALRIWMLAGTNQVYSNFANVAAVAASSTAMAAVAASSAACAAIKASSVIITALDNSSPYIIPTMTTNSAPSGLASASNEQATSWAAWKSMNKVTSDGDAWLANGTTNNWVKYAFGYPVWCYKMTLQWAVTAQANSFVKNFKVQYSSDNGTFTDALISVTTNNSNLQTFNICAPSGIGSYWRVLCLDNWGNASYTSITELQFYCK